MSADNSNDLFQVDVVVLDNRTIFPFEPSYLKYQSSSSTNKQVAVFFKTPKPATSQTEVDRDLSGIEKVGTLLRIVQEGGELVLTGEGLNFQKRLVTIGVSRCEMINTVNSKPNLAIVRLIRDNISKEEEESLKRSGKVDLLKEKALYMLQASDKNITGSELNKRNFIYNEENLVRLCYRFAMQLKLPYEESLAFLKLDTVTERVDFLLKKVEKIKVKDMLLEKDFTFDDSNPADLLRIEKLVKNMSLPEVAQKAILTEINKLKKASNNAKSGSETSNIHTYLEFVLGLPWTTMSKDNLDLKNAQEVLDEDHAGLNKVKKRIIEFLAVRSLNPKAKGSILCFHGPPGVGKTSLGKSIARALGRQYERVALGGVSDESVLRGHRRTYIGAYAGVIIQSIKRAGTRNPVILLDEVDKVGTKNYHGDLASALLEILDPQQNHKFVDHYLNIPFDLSSVFFIATANRIDTIHPALLDRMEVINLHGYSLREKIVIAEKYIVKKVEVEHGLPSGVLQFASGALSDLVKEYTSEAGVRNLEKKVASICRVLAVDFVAAREKEAAAANASQISPVVVCSEDLPKYLGPPRFKENKIEVHAQPGTAFGLAWTEVGGKVLLIETSLSRGTGKVVLTGQLGEVMRESVSTAISWIKSNFKRLKIHYSPVFYDIRDTSSPKLEAEEDFMNKVDLHVHFPSASIPKDGPSAGVAICLALVSLLTDRQVHSDLALTGEISLTGKVLPVGGIKEKLMAASQEGILKRVILPEDNRIDFETLENSGDLSVEVFFVRHIWEVLETALEHESSGARAVKKAYLGLSKL